jgi:hypothetical protein
MMKTETDQMTVEQWLATRKEAGLKIDPETAEVDWCNARTFDPARDWSEWDYAGHGDDESLGGDGADAAGGAGVALRSGTIFSSGAAGAGAGAGVGDWIIKEPIEGRYYPCKPDVFVKKYER